MHSATIDSVYDQIDQATAAVVAVAAATGSNTKIFIKLASAITIVAVQGGGTRFGKRCFSIEGFAGVNLCKDLACLPKRTAGGRIAVEWTPSVWVEVDLPRCWQRRDTGGGVLLERPQRLAGLRVVKEVDVVGAVVVAACCCCCGCVLDHDCPGRWNFNRRAIVGVRRIQLVTRGTEGRHDRC